MVRFRYPKYMFFEDRLYTFVKTSHNSGRSPQMCQISMSRVKLDFTIPMKVIFVVVAVLREFFGNVGMDDALKEHKHSSPNCIYLKWLVVVKCFLSNEANKGDVNERQRNTDIGFDVPG